MRVNVSKAFFSKTFMYGLKVLLQRQLTKSNKKPWEFYLNLSDKILKQTLVITVTQLLFVVLRISSEFAIFANLLLLLLSLLPQPHEFIIVFISHNVFCRLTFLMNDLRLKTFYCKSINSCKVIKNSTTTITTRKASKSTLNFSPLSTTCTASSAAAVAAATVTAAAAAASASSTVVFSTSAILSKQTSSNNNHNRTYNNSSKSNKVFLYYTPRDPRLRIFLKTKHFINRPQQQYQLRNIRNSNYCTSGANNKNLIKIFSDLCNYGELIGGGGHKSVECNCGGNKIFSKQLNSANLSPGKIICDNSIKVSDNLIIATAGAAIETSSANILIVIIIVAVISDYVKELLKSIEIFLSCYHNQQQLKVSIVKFTSGLYEGIV